MQKRHPAGESSRNDAADMPAFMGVNLAQRGAVRGLILCGALLIVAIVIGTAMVAASFRDRALDNATRELENTVRLLARHFDRQLEDFEAVQRTVSAQLGNRVESPEAFSLRVSGDDTHLMLRAKVSGFSDIAGVNLFGADGKLLNSSEAWPVPSVSIADRDYFQALKSGHPPTPAMMQLVNTSRLRPGHSIVIARAITGMGGEFLGVVTRGIVPSKLEEFFASVSLGEDAAISMIHNDGTMLARFPHVEAMIGKNFRAAPLFEHVLLVADHGTMRLISPVDGQERLAAAQKLAGFPVSVVATRTVAAALTDWRQQTRFLIGVAFLAALVVVVILIAIVRQLLRDHQRAQRRLALEKQRLGTALDNMTQGLLLFDSSQRLVICNQRYLDMFGVSADVVRPGCTIRELLTHRKDTGSFTGDVDQYCETFLPQLQQGKIVQTVMVTPDGRWIQVLYRPLPDGGWVTTLEDFTDRKRSEERIAHLAHYDALTDLPNRALFREHLEGQLKNAGERAHVAVLYIDIDEFKGVNDSLGHPVGDELLKAVATRLRECVGSSDFVARLGGDEFAIVQAEVGDPDDVLGLVHRVYGAIREPYECLGHQVITDASIGIALAPQDGTDLDELLRNADLAMYGAKSDGRRTYRFFEPDMATRVNARRALELDLRRAIAAQELEIHYQPLVNLHDREIVGCEALLRWRHPDRGMISPAEFIPIAEETGLINEIGEWVLGNACVEARTWPSHWRVAVNVSPTQFKSNTLALRVAGALSASGLAASRLELEITEAVLIHDDEAALTTLHQLRAVGVRVALDDFGTGYSSLSYLQRFPFDKIKIDRCFIEALDQPDGSSSIVQAVVAIAAARNMTTTAEGVETERQAQLLRGLGCTDMQGYLFSAARPASSLRPLFAVQKPRKAGAVA